MSNKQEAIAQQVKQPKQNTTAGDLTKIFDDIQRPKPLPPVRISSLEKIKHNYLYDMFKKRHVRIISELA